MTLSYNHFSKTYFMIVAHFIYSIGENILHVLLPFTIEFQLFERVGIESLLNTKFFNLFTLNEFINCVSAVWQERRLMRTDGEGGR